MDAVRLGRVLGIGARAAAKTVVGAVDAATAPNPGQRTAERPRPAEPERVTADVARPVGEVKVARPTERIRGAEAAERVKRATAQVGQTGRGLRQGGKRFGEAVWGPVVKLSGVLWLEVTGVFFGLFAVSAAVGAWKLRGALRGTGADHEAHNHMLVAAGVALLFGYFCVTSFLRARRRGRGR